MADITLGAAASRGAAVTLGAQLLRIMLQLAGVVVLARLLTPEDYGLVIMVLAIVGIADVVRDFGLGQAAVQARTLSDEQRSNLFWVNTAIGLALTLTAAALSGAIAALYDKPELQALTLGLAVTFLLRGASVQFTAGLTRSLQFGRLAIAEIAGQLIGLGLAIALAVLGFGAWALAWQQIAHVAAVLVLCVAFAGWLPGRYRRDAPIRSFVNFGVAVAGANLLNYASRNVDSVVIGVRFGANALGYYNRAFQVVTMPLTQLQAPATRVALPVLSRLQSSPQRFADFILTGQFAMLALVGVIISLCVSQSEEIIRLALGPDWLDAAPIFQVLAIGGIFQAATYASYWVFLSKGLARQQFFYALATRPLGIALVVAGSQWGVIGVAWAYTISLAIYWPVSLVWLSRISDAPALRMFVSGLRCALVVGVSTAVVYVFTDALVPEMPVLSLALGAALTLALMGIASLTVPGFRRQARETLALRRYFTPARGHASTKGPTP